MLCVSAFVMGNKQYGLVSRIRMSCMSQEKGAAKRKREKDEFVCFEIDCMHCNVD